MQLSEISIGADVVVLAMPEIGGLPYVISGLVAAGGLAAALSTADGLLLTLSNSLSHDMWYRMVSPRMSAARRVMALAGGLRLWTVVGSAHRLSGDHKPHNCAYVIDASGALVDRYDKRFCAGDAAGLGEADRHHLAGIVPFVDGRGEVEPLIALQPDQPAPERGRQHLGDLGLAGAGLALEQQRPFHPERQEEHGRQRPVGDIALGLQQGQGGVDGGRQ